MNEPTQKAWELYRSAFKDGEHVVVGDCWDTFFWGKLTSTNDGIVLTRPDGQTNNLLWGEVSFMAHDGFPVKRVMGMSATEAARISEGTSTEQIRQCMMEWEKLKESSHYVFRGDPFVIGPFSVEAIHNRGNSGSEFWDESDEEVLVLHSRGGAVMHSYDTTVSQKAPKAADTRLTSRAKSSSITSDEILSSRYDLIRCPSLPAPVKPVQANV